MAGKRDPNWLAEEVADFLATCPSREELLAFRPSAQTQERLAELLARSKEGRLSAEEQFQLSQFEHLEVLMQLVKARLRPARTARR